MKPTVIVLHHAASSIHTTLQEMNQEHKDRGFTLSKRGWYVGYHYVINWEGYVQQTRNDDEIGCHCIPNDGKIGICLIGDFTKYDPSNIQLEKLEELIKNLRDKFKISAANVKGHGEIVPTLCPGDHLQFWLGLYRRKEDLWTAIRYWLSKKI